ncbi:hypothetical protein BMP91_004918, partial [Escherichia coli]|nr:hypothetical protein [Escherichia coli]
MINNIANQSSFPAATIDSQMLLKMVNEARKLCGEKPVRNNDFIARVKDELDGEYYEIFVVQKLNNTTSETISMTYKQALRVAARESKAVRRSLVDQLESMQQQLQQKITSKYSTNGLEEFRKARALKMTVDTMKDLFGFLPNLAPEAKQVVAASLVNPVVGANVIPLPMINEHYYSASEVGSQLKISAN